jgi:hypothetical protein
MEEAMTNSPSEIEDQILFTGQNRNVEGQDRCTLPFDIQDIAGSFQDLS